MTNIRCAPSSSNLKHFQSNDLTRAAMPQRMSMEAARKSRTTMSTWKPRIASSTSSELRNVIFITQCKFCKLFNWECAASFILLFFFTQVNANCWRFKRGRENPIFNLIHSCWLFLAVLSLLVLYLAVLSLAVFTQVFLPLMSLLSQLRCQISFIEAAGQNCLTMYDHFCKANHYGQYHEVLFSRCKLYNYGIQEDVEDLLLNHLRKAGSDLNHPLTESTRWVFEKCKPVPWAALFP